MRRKRRVWLWILILSAVWLGCAMAIRASLPARLTDTETARLHEALTEWWGSDRDFYADVLYDSQGTPMWIYGESEGGCVIFNRITMRLSEAGEHRCYGDYHSVRKYYAAPLGHIVEAGAVPDELDGADEGFFFMGPNQHLNSFTPGVLGWILSNLKLPAETLNSLLSGNPLPLEY